MAFAFVAGFATVVASPASAAPAAAPTPPRCGSVITRSTTLHSDIGPCATGDGLQITASNITVNLNGHSITGSHTPPATAPTENEQVGVHLFSVSNVTVKNGTVHYFDAGVAINGGSGNTVKGVTANDNINVNLLNDTLTSCNFGDGITLNNSNNNQVLDNTTDNNGPFGGISLVNASSFNVVKHNSANANNYKFQHFHPTVPPTSVNCQQGFSRPDQGIGIRVEGPTATNNQVLDNTVTASTIYGISIAGIICNPRPGTGITPQSPSINNLIDGNHVSGSGPLRSYNGGGTVTDPSGDSNGIGILRQGPTTVVCVSNGNTITNNTSTGNLRDGIFVGGPAGPIAGPQAGNTISGNTLDGNGRDGIHVSAGALNDIFSANEGSGNAEFDGADFNLNCDNNQWQGNRFGTINQNCVNAGPPATGAVTKILALSAAGSRTDPSLTVTFSGPVTVNDPSLYTVYSDNACTVPLGTGGQAVLSGNGTFAPTVSLDAIPPVTAYYELAPNAVSGPGGIPNNAVPCTPVRFSPPPATSSVSTSGVTCGTTSVGTASPCTPTVTITNTSTPSRSGSPVLIFTNPLITSTNPDFTQSGGTCAPGVLNVGTSCTITVSFKPTMGQTGPQSATITVNDNGSGAPETFNAAGTVGQALTATSVNTPASVTCGTTPVGTPATCATETLTNPGSSTGNLTFTRTTSTSNRFTQAGGSCTAGTVLTPGGPGCTIVESFTPQAGDSGPVNTTVTINDNGTNPETFAASGNVTPPVTATSTLTPNAMAFMAKRGGSQVQTFTVTNQAGSTGPLTFGSAVASTDNPAFAVTGGTCTPSTSLAPGGPGCTVEVTYTPTSTTSAQGDTATLTIKDMNGANPANPETASLTGTVQGKTSRLKVKGTNGANLATDSPQVSQTDTGN